MAFHKQMCNKHYTTIHINEAISLVLVRALLEYRSQMTSHNNKPIAFRALLTYKTHRFHLPCVCTVNTSRKTPWHEKNKSSIVFSSFHAMTSSMIYYSIHARQNEIYLLNTIFMACLMTYHQHHNKLQSC